ncbi:MAG: hypothetical protein PHT07_10350 [Paludibacter sp.]|nr:hypothetical protein [Paludibacter sp.]
MKPDTALMPAQKHEAMLIRALLDRSSQKTKKDKKAKKGKRQ